MLFKHLKVKMVNIKKNVKIDEAESALFLNKKKKTNNKHQSNLFFSQKIKVRKCNIVSRFSHGLKFHFYRKLCFYFYISTKS